MTLQIEQNILEQSNSIGLLQLCLMEHEENSINTYERILRDICGSMFHLNQLVLTRRQKYAFFKTPID